jgi:hypothetical protein
MATKDAGMNIENLMVVTLIYSAALLMFQRTERRRKWLTALIALLPVGYMTYQWGILRRQSDVVLWAAGIALVFNLIFWIVWGRRHPPGTSDSIRVIGMED